MLEYISQYSPNCLYRDITQRVTSLQAIWILIRKWAGLKSSGCRLHAYWLVKRNYDPNGDASPTDLFYELRNAMEDSLLHTRASRGTVRYNGELPTEDEDLTPTLESTVVGDWLATLGGAALQDLVIRVYAKDLETESLADLRERITDNLETLMAEAAQPSLASTATVSWTRTNQQYPRPRAQPAAPTNRRWNTSRPPPATPRQTVPAAATRRQTASSTNPIPGAPCKLCLARNPAAARTHNLASCRLLEASKMIINAAQIF